MSDQPTPLLAFVKVFHPSGLQATLPVRCDGLGETDFVAAFNAVSAALEAGWLVTAPGLAEGEQKFQCSAVVRREKANDDNTDTPLVDLYETDNGWKSLTVYLNKPEDVDAFEKASGLNLARIPLFNGQAAPERDRKSEKFFAVPVRPFGVVCKQNPKWSQTEADAAKAADKVYKVPRRVFVRWDGQQAAPAGGNVTTPPANGDRKWETVQWFRDRLAVGPALTEFNEMMAMFPARGTPENAEVAGLYRDHAEQLGWEFDRDKKLWVFKQTPADDGQVPF